jgi:hypothetical protein
VDRDGRLSLGSDQKYTNVSKISKYMANIFPDYQTINSRFFRAQCRVPTPLEMQWINSVLIRRTLNKYKKESEHFLVV